MMTHREISFDLSVSYLLFCMLEPSQAWLEQKVEPVHANSHLFKLRSGQRILKKSKKDSKDSNYNTKESKSDKSGNGYYNYYYPGDAGFLDEDIAGDFEDMYGYIVTADHFSYPDYTSSTKSKKSSKSDYQYFPGMSYPIYEQGKGGKGGKKTKLPYYDPHMEVGQGKGAPPKLTKPPSFPNIGPPGGPPGTSYAMLKPKEASEAGGNVSVSCPSLPQHYKQVQTILTAPMSLMSLKHPQARTVRNQRHQHLLLLDQHHRQIRLKNQPWHHRMRQKRQHRP
jgi:hypothetical protein